jgi:hypothetical protein
MACRGHLDQPLRDLATILARAFSRVADKARTSAVSSAEEPHDSLDVSGPESPDHVAEGTTRRAS